jgi:nucleolar complex protein 2
MPSSKSTKKFEKNHLKDVLKKRKAGAKIKQKLHMKDKLKQRKAEDNAPSEYDTKNAAGAASKSRPSKGESLGEMSMDQFFQGGFEVPELPKAKSAKPKTGKRKRTEAAGKDASDSEDGANADSDSDSGDDMDAHKQQLEELASKDPEFYKYLQENDAELLDFDDDLAEIDALSEDDDEAETPRKKQKGEKGVPVEEPTTADGNDITKATTQKWKLAMAEKFSLRAMKEVVLAFRSAAHLNEDEDKTYKYTINDPAVYHEVLVLALQHVPKVLQHHLPVKETSAGKIRLATDSKKYRTLTLLLKSHTMAIHHLLENLSDAATLRLTLESLQSLLPYILSFKKIVKEVAKAVVAVWADSANTEVTRLSAFLVLRRLVVIGDLGLREMALKLTYQGLVKGARNTTIHTIQGINLMKNTAAELWGIDPSVGYTTGFAFIRQLAIHLRSSITNKTKDSYKTVYNWQYVHSLDFWSRVVSAHCESLREAESGKESPLRPLIYPTVQVTLGAMRLIPTAQYFPLRFQLTRSLLRISSATASYIPLAPALYEVLTSAEMRKPAKPSTLKALEFAVSIRASKAYLRTRVYQDGIGEQITELLSEFFVLWTKNIAFPELALPVLVMLKRWVKDMSKKNSGNRNGKVNNMIGLLVQKLEANTKWIEEKRSKVEFAPRHRAGVEAFLKDTEWEKSPLGAYVAGQRKSREQKAKLEEEARKVEDRKRQESSKSNKVVAKAREVVESENEDDDEEEDVEFSGAEDDDE